VRRLLTKCLEKDPRKRLRDIGDAWTLLERPAESAHSTPWWKLATAAAVIALIVAVVLLWPRPMDRPLVRLDVDLGPDAMLEALVVAAISPDGARIAFPARSTEGKQRLATRLLSEPDATVLAGTEGANGPFFSPDGQWIAFFAGDKLQKISVRGGAPVTLCEKCTLQNARGASWGDDGVIVAALDTRVGLVRIPEAGGTPQPLTQLQPGEATHRWPQVLPGSKAVLFTAHNSQGGFDEAAIEAMSVETGARKTLLRGGYFPRYLPASGSTGHLVYVREGALYGVPFDPDRLESRGAPALLLSNVVGESGFAAGRFDFSASPSGPGTFVYLSGKASNQTWPLVLLDSAGKTQPLLSEPAEYYSPRFSPDGQKLAFYMNAAQGLDIYVRDLRRDVTTRLTFTSQPNHSPIWTPDGTHLVFCSTRRTRLMWMRADGAGEARQLAESDEEIIAASFSPDGRQLGYWERRAAGADLWILPLDLSDPERPQPGKPELFLGTPANELRPVFSPDGRWIAYESDESGSFEIYVRPAPRTLAGPGGKWQISTGGGRHAMWSGGGQRLFYEALDDRLMVSDWSAAGGSFVAGKPRSWSDVRFRRIGAAGPGETFADVTPDGQRFVVFPAADPAKGAAAMRVTFLLNFFDEVRRRLPAND
jgi:serine/threonine-protein kinase